MNTVNTNYSSTEDMIIKVQSLKGITQLKNYKIMSDFYDYMNIRFGENPFAINAQGVSKHHHEVFLLMKKLQTKPQVKNMKIKYYDF